MLKRTIRSVPALASVKARTYNGLTMRQKPTTSLIELNETELHLVTGGGGNVGGGTNPIEDIAKLTLLAVPQNGKGEEIPS